MCVYVYVFCKIECCSNLCDVVEAMPCLDSPRHCQGAPSSSQKLMTKYVREFDDTPFVCQTSFMQGMPGICQDASIMLRGDLEVYIALWQAQPNILHLPSTNSYIEPPARTRFLNSRE